MQQPTRRASKRIYGRISKSPLAKKKMVLPLSVVEKLVMETLGYNDMDDMYSKIREFMKYENVVAKKNLFTNIKGMNDEETVMSVGKFLKHGRF